MASAPMQANGRNAVVAPARDGPVSDRVFGRKTRPDPYSTAGRARNTGSAGSRAEHHARNCCSGSGFWM